MEWLMSLTPAPEVAVAAVRGLLTRLGRAGKATYPFGNPVSIERVHVQVVRGSPYWVTEKSDGLRVALVLARTGPDGPGAVSVLMDRMGRMFGVPVRAPEQLFDGTVLDCELVHRPATGDHALCVFDVACLDGCGDVALNPLSHRLHILHRMFEPAVDNEQQPQPQPQTQPQQDMPHDCVVSLRADLRFVAKQMWPLTQLQLCIEAAARLPHATDGFVLTPERCRASLPGTAWDVFKVKAAHTIDLKWADGALWYGDADELFRLSALDTTLVQGLVAPPGAPAPELMADVPPGSIVELTPRVVHDSHAPQRAYIAFVAASVRPDRDVPNNVVCVTRTLKSVLDAVTMADLMS